MLTYPKIDSRRLALEKQEIKSQWSFSSVAKRTFDILVAIFVTLTILIWLIPLVGLFIKLTSPGPVLFIQDRMGQNKRRFRCLKLRTMRHEKDPVFSQALQDDERFTPIGKWLRKTNLDEMPQFLNVLMGDMSIVGPRPHAIQHDAQYWDVLPNYPRRYLILPGITGLAQVRGARGITDSPIKMQKRLRYDLYYIQKKTLLLDIKICYWTVKKVFEGDDDAW